MKQKKKKINEMTDEELQRNYLEEQERKRKKRISDLKFARAKAILILIIMTIAIITSVRSCIKERERNKYYSEKINEENFDWKEDMDDYIDYITGR